MHTQNVYIIRSTSSKTTIEKLRECFTQHGLPDNIVSDNAAYFASEEFAEFTRINGIQHTFVAPYHPSGNGLAERAVQTIKTGLANSKIPLYITSCTDFCYNTV